MAAHVVVEGTGEKAQSYSEAQVPIPPAKSRPHEYLPAVQEGPTAPSTLFSICHILLPRPWYHCM